jgi:hypothetical protein
MKESTIQSAILAWLNSLKGVIAENVIGNSHQAGRPDINACVSGKTLRIEVKTPANKNGLTPLQNENLLKWARCGAKCCVITSFDEAITIMEQDPYSKNWELVDCNPLFCDWCMNKACAKAQINEWRKQKVL